MGRTAHGGTTNPIVSSNPIVGSIGALTFGPQASQSTAFGYLFDGLQQNLPIPASPAHTLELLAELGSTMVDTKPSAANDSDIPSGYTYFGQFVDHDISVTSLPKELPDSCELNKSDLSPWPLQTVLSVANNLRTNVLELDSVYGVGALKEGESFHLGRVSESQFPIKCADLNHDLVRRPRNANPHEDGEALIPDKRNDTNLIISQLHVAFLRAHNEIVKREKCLFEDARIHLLRLYHWIIINDFLPCIADHNEIEKVKAEPRYRPEVGTFYLPLEFTVAAYRFGHCMIRNTYYLNKNYPGEELLNLFVLNVLSDCTKPTFGKGFDQIPQKRIINWEFFFNKILNRNVAKKIRTQMSDPLFQLLDEKDEVVHCERRLAVQDLKRGFMLRMPSGQAVAADLGYDKLTPEQVREYSTDEQKDILEKSGFDKETPLWYYVLVEAMAHADGKKLGKVGSRIVAEVLIGLVRKSPDSFLKDPNYSPPYSNEGKFNLPDLLRLAGVLV